MNRCTLLMFMQERWGCTDRVKEAPKDFKTFLMDTFTVMDPKALENSFGVGRPHKSSPILSIFLLTLERILVHVDLLTSL